MREVLLPVHHYEVWHFGPYFHDEPFLLLVHPKDTVRDVKRNVRTKLGISEKEFSNWRVTLKIRGQVKFAELLDGECGRLFGYLILIHFF